jgi:3-oxoacyl-[acyl-carrier-protein] synthase-3
MAIGFEHLTMVVPSTSKSVFDLADSLGEPAATAELLRCNGLSRVPVAIGWSTADLIDAAIRQVLIEASSLRDRIGLVLLVHSLPAPAPHDVDLIALCLDPHGLADVPAVVITGQPCAILHQAIALAASWTSTADDKAVLIVGADVANHDQERIFFGSAMGDAAIAGLLIPNASRHQLLATLSDTKVYAWNGEYSPKEAVERFRSANPSMIRAAIENCLAMADLKVEDVSLICAHTPNRLIWDSVAALLRVPRDRIYDDRVVATGHLNSNDSFVHYLNAIQVGRLHPGDIAVLINAGFGGTRGCTVLRC